jgi:hypothetical protein
MRITFSNLPKMCGKCEMKYGRMQADCEECQNLNNEAQRNSKPNNNRNR